MILLDLAANAFGALVAFSIAYFSLRAYRLVGDRRLLLLNLSFSLMGAGMAVQALAKVRPVEAILSGVRIPPVRALPEVAAAYSASAALRGVAYAILVYAYWAGPAALALVERWEVSELFLTALALAAAAQSLMGYARERSAGGLLVSLGFGLLSFAHSTSAFMPGPWALVVYDLAQLAGFACFLSVLLMIRVRGVGEG